MIPTPTLLAALAALALPQDLDQAGFERWRDYLVPAVEDEGWLDVGWRSAFWEGVLEAHEVRRPILLWAMNGHPLGCT